MPKYVLAYHGGGMAPPEDADAVMKSWIGWFETLGSAVVDGGNPTGAVVATVNADGSVSSGGGANPLSGYSLVNADSIDAATTLAKGCPILAAGGSVEVSECIEM